jgi:pimeloyl-ACP methyl ester carboxylesterase
LAGAAGWQLVEALRRKPRLATTPEPLAAPENVRTAIVEGIQMRWEEHGEVAAPLTVVFVHGLPTHPRLWRYVIPRVLRPGVRCLAWEMVGYGWSMSAGMGRNISVARQAEYLYFWLQHLGIERAVLVGHDLGGGVVQRMAVLYPEVCAGIMLTDCVAYDNWPVPPIIAARKLSGALEKMPPALLKCWLRRGIQSLGDKHNPVRRTSARLHAQPYGQAFGPAAFADQVRSINNLDTMNLASELPRVSVPARVVWGAADLLPVESGKRLAADLQAPFRLIPGAKHFTPEDHPNIVAQAINEVLGEAAPSASGEAVPPPLPFRAF